MPNRNINFINKQNYSTNYLIDDSLKEQKNLNFLTKFSQKFLSAPIELISTSKSDKISKTLYSNKDESRSLLNGSFEFTI